MPFKKTDLLRSIATLPTAIPGKYYRATEQDLAGGCLPFPLDNVLFHKNVLRNVGTPSASYALLDQIAEHRRASSVFIVFLRNWNTGLGSFAQAGAGDVDRRSLRTTTVPPAVLALVAQILRCTNRSCETASLADLASFRSPHFALHRLQLGRR